MSREARVGIFVLLGLLVLTYFTFRVSKWGGIARGGYELTVDFDTAAGIDPKADVKMAGVPIGKVERIDLVGNRARLVLRIEEDFKIPADSTASIQSLGLLGEKYVEILPGQDVARPLPPGGQIARTQAPADIDQIVRKVSLIADDVRRFTETLSGTLGTPEGKKAVEEILRNVREATAALRNVVAANEDRLDRILANVDALSGDLKDISSANKEDLRAMVANLRAFSETLKTETPGLATKLEKMSEQVSGAVGENRENLKAAIESLRGASAKLDNTLDRIARGEGTLGKLVTEDTAHTSLTEALDGINRFVRRADRLQTYLDYRLEYQTRPGESKHFVNLRLQPSIDRYYLLGVVDDPRGKFETTTTTTTVDGGASTTVTSESFSNDLKFTGLVAKKWSNFTVRGGIIESTGGLGLDYDLFGGRLTLGVDAFDFTRPHQPPHLKLFGNYDIVKSLFVTGGADDILNDEKDLRTFFLGFGIKFKDEDLKTVIGTVPIRP